MILMFGTKLQESKLRGLAFPMLYYILTQALKEQFKKLAVRETSKL